VLQYPVDSVLNGDLCVARFNVDVAGSAFESREDYRFNEFYNWTAGGVSCKPVTRDRFFRIFVDLRDL